MAKKETAKMVNRIQTPAGLYDPQWIEFNRQSVGADATPEETAAAAKVAEDAAKATKDAEAAAKAAEDAKKETPEQLRAKIDALTAEKAELLKETLKRKDKLKAAADEKTATEATLAKLNETVKALLGEDITIEDLQAKVQERKAAEVEALKKSGDFDKLQARLVAEHKKEIDKINGAHGAVVKDLTVKQASADAEIRRLLVTNNFAGSTFIKDELVLTPVKAEKLFGEHFKVEETDGKRVTKAYVGSEPLLDKDGHPLGFELALREIVSRDPEKDSLFKANARKGAGSGIENKGKEIDKTLPKGVAAISQGLKELEAAKK